MDRSDQAVAERRQELGRLKAETTRSEAALRAMWEMIVSGVASSTDTDVAERMVLHRTPVEALVDEIRVIEISKVTQADV